MNLPNPSNWFYRFKQEPVDNSKPYVQPCGGAGFYFPIDIAGSGAVIPEYDKTTLQVPFGRCTQWPGNFSNKMAME